MTKKKRDSLKVLSIVISEPISVNPMGNRLYKIANKRLTIRIYTNQGCLVFVFEKGFVTNFRSGGRFVDAFVDQIGNTQTIQACWLFHDLCYTPGRSGEHVVSRKLADELLYAALIYAGMNTTKAALVYYSVRLCGESAYEEDDALTSSNSKLFSFEWSA